MLEYLYIVHTGDKEFPLGQEFYMFEDARAFALENAKYDPYIEQIEIERNDFGECTDHRSLGTVWSLKEETPLKPAVGEYSTADLERIEAEMHDEVCLDGECQTADSQAEPEPKYVETNSVDKTPIEPNLQAISDTLNDLALTLETCAEEAGFEVECYTDASEIYIKVNIIKGDFDAVKVLLLNYLTKIGLTPEVISENRELNQVIFDKIFMSACEPEHKMLAEYVDFDKLVETLEENEDEVECKWCNELWPKEDCKHEINLGYLCPDCVAALKSRGEQLVLEEDVLDESVSYLDEGQEITTSDLIELINTGEFDIYLKEPIWNSYNTLATDSITICGPYTDGHYEAWYNWLNHEGEEFYDGENIGNSVGDVVEFVSDFVSILEDQPDELVESQSQEISKIYNDLSKDFKIDFEELVYGKDGFMQTKYPNGFPDFAGDVVYSEKYWNELVEFAKTKGINLKNDSEKETLVESTLVKGTFKISDSEVLEWGWDKYIGYYVEKLFKPSENSDIWQSEFKNTYATYPEALKAFEKYKQKISK